MAAPDYEATGKDRLLPAAGRQLERLRKYRLAHGDFSYTFGRNGYCRSVADARLDERQLGNANGVDLEYDGQKRVFSVARSRQRRADAATRDKFYSDERLDFDATFGGVRSEASVAARGRATK